MTFPFRPYKVYTFPQWHQDFTCCKINGLDSGKPGCHRPHRTSSTLKMSPSCQGFLHHSNRPTMMSIRIPRTAEINASSCESKCHKVHWVEHQIVSVHAIVVHAPTKTLSSFTISLKLGDQHLYLFAFIIYTLRRENLEHKPGFLWHTEWQHLSPGQTWIGQEGDVERHPPASWLDSA